MSIVLTLRDGRHVEFVDRRPARTTAAAHFLLPDGSIQHVPLTEFDESDVVTRSWIDGYLRGVAPTYNEFVGDLDTDEESSQSRELVWQYYLDYLEAGFERRDYRLFGYRWPIPTSGMRPSDINFAWTLVGAIVTRWTASGWVIDAQERSYGLTVLPGTECVRIGHDFRSDVAYLQQCSRCGYTDFFEE